MGGFHGEQETQQGKAPGREGRGGEKRAMVVLHFLLLTESRRKSLYIHVCSVLHRDSPNNLPKGDRPVQNTTTGAKNVGK